MPDEKNQGVGLIFPPPDIRGVIDKTAQFVAKCGPEFEQRVLREQNNTKFAFLLPTNPYRPYYEHKVKEFKTGVVEETKPEVPQAVIDAKAKDEEKKKRKEQLKALTMGEKAKEVKPPPPDQYIVNHPYIAPMDMDIIKLTAQFVARNGQKFLIGLTQRESRNPQFDFLKPTHALFGYFTSLVDAYTKCLMPNKDEIEKLKKAVESPLQILDRALARFQWDEQEERKAKSQEEEEAQEREHMATIDWHEFMVVETIEFTAEDENIALAAPIDVSTGAPQGAPQPLDKAGTLSQAAQIEKPKGIEEEAKTETELDVAPDAAAPAPAPEPEEAKPSEEPTADAPAEVEENVPEEEPLAQEPEIPLPPMDPEMKIRKDYIRSKKASAQRVTQRCPITGQLIPAEEMSNHLKILLLDPKWKQQKDQLVERARKESAFADDVEANLASFVAKRPDLFGSVDEQIREAAEAGAEAAARDAGADAGPAHTMVPPAAALAQATQKLTAPAAAGGALPNVAAGGLAGTLSVMGGGLSSVSPGVLAAGVNARLPGTKAVTSVNPLTDGADAEEDDDDDVDDEPASKRQKTSSVNLVPEEEFQSKNSTPVQVTVQVNFGPEMFGADLPSTVQLQLPVKTTVIEVKKMLVAQLPTANLTPGKMRLKAQAADMVMKNPHSIAFYNIGSSSVIELSGKQRGGKTGGGAYV